MRRVITFVVVALVAASCAKTVDVEKEKAALMTVDADWSKTTGDADKFVSYLAPDATMAMTGAPGMKPAEVKTAFAVMTKAPGYSLTCRASRKPIRSGRNS